MSRAAASDELIIGGEPRVDLLPPEVKATRRAKTLRRGLAAVVVAVVVLVAAGVTAASFQAMQSQTDLQAAQARTNELLAEQTKYVEVRQVQDEVDATVAARQLGASTEVDWKAYLIGLRDVLPGDVTIDTVGVDAASPLAPYGQATVPLQALRVATLTLSLTSPSLPTVPDWLDAMSSLPGYVDGTPGSITRLGTGAYQVDLTVHINEDAYSNRFADSDTTEDK